MVLAGRLGRLLLFGGFVVYLALPLTAVMLYAFATRWTAHVLPDGYTIQHLFTALHDPRLYVVTLRTLGLSTTVTLLDVLLVVPATYWQWARNPRIRIFLALAAAIPFVLPFVVIAFGILTLSGQIVPMLQGTVPLLVLGHIAITFPFLYWAVDGAMAAANVHRLDEAAQTCGAGPSVILWRVVLPNIGAGIATGSMLVFATSFGEFALVQLLVGNRFETISLYSLALIGGANGNYNELAVITCFTFMAVFLVSVAAVYWNRGQIIRAFPGGETMRGKR